MQDLNIAEAGFSYIFKCIRAYYEGNIYFILYIAALAFLSLAGSGYVKKRLSPGNGDAAGGIAPHTSDRKMREIFLPQFIMMALTVYNPVFPVILNSFFDVNKEYYRFLWMSPVIICIAAAAAIAICNFATGVQNDNEKEISGSRETRYKVFDYIAAREKEEAEKDTALDDGEEAAGDIPKRGLHNVKSKTRTVLAVMFFVCLLIAGGSFLYKDGYILSPNRYHMPTEIPEVSRIIHEDADKRAGVSDASGKQSVYPRAMFEYDYQMQIRQYDAGILLTCDREEYLTAFSGEITAAVDEEHGNYIERLLAVMALGLEIKQSRFLSALEHTGTEYLVVTSGSNIRDYLEDAGLSVVGETANHTVFHYEPEEPQEFELPDYSEVWRLTPQWYDFLL